MERVISEIFAALFETILINLWCRIFLSEKKITSDKKREIILRIMIFVILLMNNLFVKNALSAITFTCICTFLEFLQFDYKKRNGILLSLYLCAIIAICDMLSLSIIKLFSGENFDILRNTLSFRFVGSTSSKFMTLTIIRIISSKKRIIFSKKKLNIRLIIHLLILPVISLIIINQLVLIPNPDRLNLSIQNILITFGLLAANLFDFNFFLKEQEYEYFKYKTTFLEAEIKMQSSQYEMIKKSNYELRKVRHDLKNTLLALIGLIKNNENDKAEKFINNELNLINTTNEVISTGYYSIDNLVNYKIQQAKRSKIDFSPIISLGKNMVKIDEMDLCIMLGNAIDNAFEEVTKINGEPKKVSLEMSISNGFLVIAIQNTCRSDIFLKSHDLLTTKTDKINHGFGVETIRTITKYYNGYCDFSIEKGIFILTITLINDFKFRC